MRAPPRSHPAPSGFDSLLAETVLSMESRVAHVATTAGLAVTGLVLAALASGSHIPRIILAVTLGFFAWYAGVVLLLRTGRFRPWMRYASSLVDVSMGSAVALLDLHVNGPAFAVSAGGPALYAVGVAMATPRLQPRLCLFAGLAAAAQHLVLVQLVLRPAASPELLATGAFDLYVSLAKALFLVTIGALGLVASRSMRSLLVRLTESAVERVRVRGVLGMHVSEQVMEHLLSGRMPEGGERRAITVCFTDIRGFTRLSESQPPEETLRLLNLYFGRMCEIVAAHGGLVNKFLGDGMLVVFGAPTHQPDDARRALAAAREMLAEARRMQEAGFEPLGAHAVKGRLQRLELFGLPEEPGSLQAA
ncbi:MAG: adenylate/guanylate cyclase domain-containing protein [Archangium sp.]